MPDAESGGGGALGMSPTLLDVIFGERDSFVFPPLFLGVYCSRFRFVSGGRLGAMVNSAEAGCWVARS